MATTYEPPHFLFDESHPPTPFLSETNLTLLCLDYLRDLRRSYTPSELWEAEGLDADYLSLAVWALGRMFVRPAKLQFEGATVCKMKEDKREFCVIGGGGVSEDIPSFGNDCMYRSIKNTAVNHERYEWNTRAEIKNIRDAISNGYCLTGNIVIPRMEDINDEIMLIPKENRFGIDSDAPNVDGGFEYNDAHASNAHRYYLLNGLASGGGEDDKLSLAASSNNSRSGSFSQACLALHGGPVTLGEIVHAGTTALGARTRIEAEREMVFNNPLFEQFVRAVSSKGFFTEKKSEKKKDATCSFTSSEDEQKRARVAYEEKYRKVVNKFRNKMAANAEVSQPQQNQMQGMRYQQQHGMMQYPYSMMKYPPQSMDAFASLSVADRQQKMRKMKIERVRAEGKDGYYLNQEKGRMQQQQMNYQNQYQQKPTTVQTRQQIQPPPTRHWETTKSQNHPPSSTKSILSTQFNFVSHSSPFTGPSINNKSSTPPRSNRSKSAVMPPIQTISQLQPTPKQSESEMGDEEANMNLHEAELLNTKGNAYMQKKQFDEALQSYTAALELCPDAPNSHVYYSNRSAAHLSLNDHVNSIRDSYSSLQLCPGYTKAHSRLGLAYFVSGQYEEAVKAYEVALEYEPDNDWNRSHYEKALNKLPPNQRESLQKQPVDEETASELDKTLEADQYKDAGNAHMSKKEYELALEQYTLAISTSPAGSNSHVYYSNRAAAYCYLGQYNAAANDCMLSIDINPKYEKAHARLGLSRFFLEDFQGAIEAYGRALELDPNNAASKSYMAKAKKQLEEKMEAETEKKSQDFMEQQEELQKAMENQLMMQRQDSKDDGHGES